MFRRLPYNCTNRTKYPGEDMQNILNKERKKKKSTQPKPEPTNEWVTDLSDITTHL